MKHMKQAEVEAWFVQRGTPAGMSSTAVILAHAGDMRREFSIANPGRRLAEKAPKEKSPAPCFACSKKLHGGAGRAAIVDGHRVIFHPSCLAKTLDDPDLTGRVAIPGAP